MRLRLPALCLLIPLLGACAGNPPRGLGDELPPLSQRAAQSNPGRHLGAELRWGGEILGVENAALFTDVEIYGRPLFNNAEPKPEGGEGVRFIARVPGFLDPAEHATGKRMAVRGRLGEPVQRKVGEYLYHYPLVEVSAHHLWPAYREPPEPAWFRDPYYDRRWPWHPWGPRPYRRWPYGW